MNAGKGRQAAEKAGGSSSKATHTRLAFCLSCYGWDKERCAASLHMHAMLTEECRR